MRYPVEEKNVLGIEKNFEAEGQEFARICERSEQCLKQTTIFNLLFEIPIRSRANNCDWNMLKMVSYFNN